MKKIAVIGAGITGITTAYQLMKKGYDVTVFDKQKYAAMETSYANGGQLSACNGEVWTNWKTIYQGIQWIFKKDAPLSINLKPSLHKIGWFLSFLSNVKNHEKNTIATVKMAIESGNLLKELLKNGRETNLEISKRIKLAPSATLGRIKSLEDDGFIHSYSARINHNKVCIKLICYTHVRVESNNFIDEVATQLCDIEEVLEVYEVMGGASYFVKLAAENNEDAQRIIQKIGNIY